MEEKQRYYAGAMFDHGDLTKGHCVDLGICTQKAAEEAAWEMAQETYQSYEGLHGVGSVEDIQEENPDWGNRRCLARIRRKSSRTN